MPKLLILSRYDELGASSRLRMLQYVPALQATGWNAHVEPLFSNEYLETIYQVRRGKVWHLNRLALVARAYFHRVLILLQCRHYDIVWVEKELFPFLPAFFERLLSDSGVPYIVDYDDAIFHNYDRSESRFLRNLIGDKLKRLIAGARAVTVGNDYLAAYARSKGAQQICSVPTVIDITRYQVVDEPPDGVFRIGWVGSPSSAQYLPVVYAPLQRLAEFRNIVFVTVGAPPIAIAGVTVEQHDWTLESEVRLIQGFHLGIMPLNDTPWERGKCGYKLIQYMACGRPVVASPVGVNREIVTARVGQLARTEDDWFEALNALAANADLRQRQGAEARLMAEKHYTQQIVAPQIDSLLRSHVRKDR
jgi:glycosyltransferase involved in cell wall biosynthesis